MLGVLALLLVIPVLTEYARTGLVPRLPTFVGACFLGVFSLQCLVCGLILDTQGKAARQSFELQMNLIYAIHAHDGENRESHEKETGSV